MARKPKPRLFNDIELPDNLYPDPRKRPDYWRYKRKDGTFKTFILPLEDAVKEAVKANKIGSIQDESIVPSRASLARFIEEYIPYRESLDPGLLKKGSWQNRKSALRQLAKIFSHIPVNLLKLQQMQPWWDDLSGYAQRSKRSEFNKLFNYLMSRDATPRLKGNPFTTADDRPRLISKPLPKKSKVRITIKDFWEIYNKAGEMNYIFIQIGMSLCLLTTMRRGDFCTVRLDKDIIDNKLCKGISKSIEKAQNGIGEYLRFDLSDYHELRKTINRAREHSLKNSRCPYVVSHRYEKHNPSKVRSHKCQVLPGFFTNKFAEVRDSLPKFQNMPEKNRPGIHEVRALSSHLLKKSGYAPEEIMQMMAHTDVEMQKVYQAEHEIEYTDISMVLTSKNLGGSF